MTSVAVARYVLADVARSQRFIVPAFVFVALLGVLFGGDPGPAPGGWAASAFALYPISTWLAITIANTEDVVARQITVAAAGGARPVALGVLLVCLLADVVLAGLAAVRPLIPLLTALYPYSPAQVLAGALGHLAVALTGTAVGLLCARPVIDRIGWSLLAATTVVVVTGVTPWLPPAGTAVKALGALPLPVGALAVDAVLALALAGAATAVVASRH